MAEIDWQPDILGTGYRQHIIELGEDPDGEGDVCAVMIRRDEPMAQPVRAAVLYVHGFSDYFFQTSLADFLAERGLAFYALDLRKSGRARRDGQTAHYVSNLAMCDAELEHALSVVAAEHPELPVLLVGHSTGGLMLSLWLDRRRRAGRVAPITGMVLNSPWFDLQLPRPQRDALTRLVRLLARVQPFRALPVPTGVYGSTLHVSGTGEWEFDLVLKPLGGFPVTVGWLNAVRRGQAELQRGLDVGVPSLLLRSTRSHFAKQYDELSDRADTVLDVRQIARWSGCLGNEVSVVPIADARHDVFLSVPEARVKAYEVLDSWLQAHLARDVTTTAPHSESARPS